MQQINVVNAIIKYKGRFLIVQRNLKSRLHPGKWSFPGGKLKQEETILEGLKRAIKEETSLEVDKSIIPIAEYQYKRPEEGITLGKSFLVFAIHNKVRLSKELSSFAWISPEELKNYQHIEGMEEELEKAKGL